MDRRLKERLTGASILVLIAVLFIPELLSGPPKRATAPLAMPPVDLPTNAAATVRTYTVDLNHPPSEASAMAASAGESDAPTPASAANASSAQQTGHAAPASALETPPARPQIQTLPAAVPPQPVEPAMPSEAPVVSGAPVAHEHAAETQAAHAPARDTFAPISAKGGWSIQLGSFGNRANADKLVRSMRSKGIRVYVSSQAGKHRVRAGPFPDRATAERMGDRLKSQGQSFTIIAP
jgi:DedD protein